MLGQIVDQAVMLVGAVEQGRSAAADSRRLQLDLLRLAPLAPG